LLVEAHAKVNAANHLGQTPLLIASSANGNAATVKYLIAHGAKVDTPNTFGVTPVIAAGGFGGDETVRVLLEHGANAQAKDKADTTPLWNVYAYESGSPASVDLLLKQGADVNSFDSFAGMVKNGPIALTKMTPLMLVAPYAPVSEVNKLLDRGAQVSAVDVRQMSPLMLAVATDYADAEKVAKLIRAGADVNQRDIYGQSVLDWAIKFGDPKIIQLLRDAGAKTAKDPVTVKARGDYRAENVTDAITRSSGLLAQTGQGFFREGGGCYGCHHQVMDARAFAAVKSAGLPTNAQMRQVLLDAIVAMRARVGPASLNLMDIVGGDIDPYLYSLNALADMGDPASKDTDMRVHYIAARQKPSGEWFEAGVSRPPIEESSITRTALAIRALKVYGWPARQAEFRERIERGRRWLESAVPLTNYERADLVMGLYWAGSDGAFVEKAAADLLVKQRSDGGWAQTRFLESDAYATGLALHALYITGRMKPTDAAYQKAVAYLLATQYADGSWYVRSRAPKFQPYFQSGFPYEHDQWISSAATAWAVIGLAPAAQVEMSRASE
jgi:ankyrin repeat protein